MFITYRSKHIKILFLWLFFRLFFFFVNLLTTFLHINIIYKSVENLKNFPNMWKKIFRGISIRTYVMCYIFLFWFFNDLYMYNTGSFCTLFFFFVIYSLHIYMLQDKHNKRIHKEKQKQKRATHTKIYMFFFCFLIKFSQQFPGPKTK